MPRRILLLLTARTYRAGPFMTAAERLGIEVVKAVDMHHHLADYWRYPLGLDFADLNTSTQAIVDFSRHTPIGAILAVDDSGSLLAAHASQALGLPHNAPESSRAARDKHVMREMLASRFVPAPSSRRYSFTTLQDTDKLRTLASEVRYPCVLKPVDLSGSRGVIRANNSIEFVAAASRLQRLLLALDPISERKHFLVEQYVHGDEFALEGILLAGELRVLAIFDKPDPLTGPFFEETIYVTPSRLPAGKLCEIEKVTAKAAMALGLREGPVHAELRLNEKGPWIIEVASRSIGGLCSNTLRFTGNTSLEELIIRQAFGLDLTSYERESMAGGVMMIPIPESGLLRNVAGCDLAEAVPLVESVEITARLNYSIRRLPEGDGYLGFIFARGETPEAVEDALREAHEKLRIEISPEIPLRLGRSTALEVVGS